MSFTRPSVQTELDRFFKALSGSSTFDSITKSAFTQSRKKLSHESFVELYKTQLSYFDTHAKNNKSWKGKRVVAIDGSLLNLPHTKDIEEEFGGVANQHEMVVSARCSFAYDVCNELVLDAKIAKRRSCEKELARTHLSSLDPKNDILVFDRGYPAQWLFELLKREGFDFCFRLSTAWRQANKLMVDQTDIDWTLPRDSTREWSKLREYGFSRKTEGLRLLAIPLASGEKELLVTNILDRNQYDLSAMKELYNLRWGVEEGYKVFKKVLHIEHFTGKTPLAIKQDFYAKVMMLNISSMIRSQALNHINRSTKKHKLQVNKTQTLAKLKDFLVDLFYSNEIKSSINQMLKLLKNCYEVIRKNRSFTRTKTSSRRRHKIMTSKGI